MSSFDLYTEVTEQIAAMLDQGIVPWRSPILGRSKAGHPRNLNTGKHYRGVNVFLLAFTAFAKPPRRGPEDPASRLHPSNAPFRPDPWAERSI